MRQPAQRRNGALLRHCPCHQRPHRYSGCAVLSVPFSFRPVRSPNDHFQRPTASGPLGMTAGPFFNRFNVYCWFYPERLGADRIIFLDQRTSAMVKTSLHLLRRRHTMLRLCTPSLARPQRKRAVFRPGPNDPQRASQRVQRPSPGTAPRTLASRRTRG